MSGWSLISDVRGEERHEESLRGGDVSFLSLQEKTALDWTTSLSAVPMEHVEYFQHVRDVHQSLSSSSPHVKTHLWTSLFNFVLDFAVYHRSIDSRYAFHLFEAMDELEVPKDLASYSTALRLFRHDHFSFAKSLIEHVLRNELSTTAQILTHDPETLAYFLEQVVEVLAHGHKWEQITQVHSHIQSCLGSSRSNHALRDVVTAFKAIAHIRMGQSEEGLRTLEAFYQHVLSSTDEEEAVEGRMYAVWNKVMSLAGHYISAEYVGPFTQNVARFGIRDNGRLGRAPKP
jgi:hypothetical protein